MFLREKGQVTDTSGLANFCSLKNSQSRNCPSVGAFQFAEDRLPWDHLLFFWSSLFCSFSPLCILILSALLSPFSYLYFFLQYSFCVFSIHGLSQTELFCDAQSGAALLQILLPMSFSVLSLFSEAFHHSGLVQCLLQWDLLLLSNNMIDISSTNKLFICTLRFLNQGDFSCNYSLLHEELKECNKYTINANIHKFKCPRLFMLRNMQVHSYVSLHVSGTWCVGTLKSCMKVMWDVYFLETTGMPCVFTGRSTSLPQEIEE